MVKKNGNPVDEQDIGLRASRNQDAASGRTGEQDIEVLASTLASEFDSLDITLIHAILLDYDQSDIQAALPEIRQQLEILQISAIPDDQPGSETDEALSRSINALSNDLESTAITSATSVLARNPPSENEKEGFHAEEDPKVDVKDFGAETQDAYGEASTHSVLDEKTGDLEGENDLTTDIQLLASLFPELSPAQLQTALTESISLDAAIEHLLSVELIRDVEQNGSWRDGDTSAESEGAWLPIKAKKRSPGSSFESLPMAKTGSTSSEASTSRSQRFKENNGSDSILIKPKLIRPKQRSKKAEQLATYSLPSPSPSQQPSRPPSPLPRQGLSTGSSPNAWHTLASLATQLSDLLPSHKDQYFLSYLHSHKYRSPYAALRASLSAIGTKESSFDHASESVLQDIYGLTLEQDERKARNLKLLMRVTEDISVIMDLMDVLEDVSTWPADTDNFSATDSEDDTKRVSLLPRPAKEIRPALVMSTNRFAREMPSRMRSKPKKDELEHREKIIPGAQASESSYSHPTAYDDFGTRASAPSTPKLMPANRRQMHAQNWRKVVHVDNANKITHPYAQSSPTYASENPRSLYASTSSSNKRSAEDYLRRATIERQRRETAIRSASNQFQGQLHLPGGKHINASVAGHYASEARKAQDRAIQYELKAARIIISNQLEATESVNRTIDLHHLTVFEAVTIAKETAQKWYDREKVREHVGIEAMSKKRENGFVPSKNLTIITGVGRHSAGNKGVLGPAVSNALESDGWRVDRGESTRGFLIVKGKK